MHEHATTERMVVFVIVIDRAGVGVYYLCIWLPPRHRTRSCQLPITEGSGPTASLPKSRELRGHLVHIPSASDQRQRPPVTNHTVACAFGMRDKHGRLPLDLLSHNHRL